MCRLCEYSNYGGWYSYGHRPASKVSAGRARQRRGRKKRGGRERERDLTVEDAREDAETNAKGLVVDSGGDGGTTTDRRRRRRRIPLTAAPRCASPPASARIASTEARASGQSRSVAVYVVVRPPCLLTAIFPVSVSRSVHEFPARDSCERPVLSPSRKHTHARTHVPWTTLSLSLLVHHGL